MKNNGDTFVTTYPAALCISNYMEVWHSALHILTMINSNSFTQAGDLDGAMQIFQELKQAEEDIHAHYDMFMEGCTAAMRRISAKRDNERAM